MICSDIWDKYHDFTRVKFETILKYHNWYLYQISHTNHAIICLYYYHYLFISTTTALSQSNCRNFSCSSIITEIYVQLTLSSERTLYRGSLLDSFTDRHYFVP